MALVLASINSGSNGNCYYIGNGREAVLIDAGISCREIEKRLTRLGLPMSSLRAIFVTHEHTDHIKGVEVLSKKFKIPVYITSATLANSKLFIQEELLHSFTANKSITIGDLKILPITKSHDAADPHSFMVTGAGINVGVLTDIGIPCLHVIDVVKQSHALFLEANYDEKMLEQGPYPYYLKQRISSDEGHLSNRQALELYLKYGKEKIRHLILTHLSKENNSPQLVHKLFSENAPNANVLVASRDFESDLIHLELDADGAHAVITKNQSIEKTSLF